MRVVVKISFELRNQESDTRRKQQTLFEFVRRMNAYEA